MYKWVTLLVENEINKAIKAVSYGAVWVASRGIRFILTDRRGTNDITQPRIYYYTWTVYDILNRDRPVCRTDRDTHVQVSYKQTTVLPAPDQGICFMFSTNAVHFVISAVIVRECQVSIAFQLKIVEKLLKPLHDGNPVINWNMIIESYFVWFYWWLEYNESNILYWNSILNIH